MAIDKSDISFSYMTWCVTKQGYLSRLRFQSKSNQQKTERRNFFCRFYGAFTADVNDFLANSIGAVCGYLLWLCCHARWPKAFESLRTR